MIKAVLSDLDNTLYDYSKSSKIALKKIYPPVKKESKISYEKFIKVLNKSKEEVRKELKHSPDSHDRIVYFQRFGETLNLPPEFALRIYEKYYQYFLKAIKPRKNVLKVLKILKSKGIKTVVITNEVVEIQLKKLKKIGLSEQIEFLVASEEVGADKPDKRIFLRALKKLNLSANQVIMVGDSEREDILGAKKAGIKSILFSQNKIKKSKANFIIKDFEEILEIARTN